MPSKERVKQSVEYVLNGIENTVKTCGKRSTAGKGEKKAQLSFAEELRHYCEKVRIEEFKLSPNAFTGWLPISACFIILAQILCFFVPIVAVVFVIIAIIPLFSQFVFYRRLMDPLFTERISQNVYAVKKPLEETKRRIVFVSNADANCELTIKKKLGNVGLIIEVVMALIGIVYTFAAGIAICAVNGTAQAVMPTGVSLVLALIGMVFLPFFVGMFMFFNKKQTIDGANDGLTGCYEALAMLKTFKEEEIVIKNTEIGVLITGGREVGLRGTKSFVEENAEEFSDVETIFIVMKTLNGVDKLRIFNYDLNNLVKNDESVCSLLKKAGRECGYDFPFASMSLGATEAAVFSQAGLKATCIGTQTYDFMTRESTVSMLDEDCLGVIYDVMMNVIRIYDENGLSDTDGEV